MTEKPSLREFALEAITAACRLSREELDARGSTAELALDSLTIVSIVSRIEAVFELEFRGEDVLRLLQATDLAALLGVLDDVAASADASIGAAS